jgi:hypothetical protein
MFWSMDKKKWLSSKLTCPAEAVKYLIEKTVMAVTGFEIFYKKLHIRIFIKRTMSYKPGMRKFQSKKCERIGRSQ